MQGQTILITTVIVFGHEKIGALKLKTRNFIEQILRLTTISI